jgi:hypothetical protein
MSKGSNFSTSLTIFVIFIYVHIYPLQTLQKKKNIEEEGTFSSSFYKTSITLISKTVKDIISKETMYQYSLWI